MAEKKESNTIWDPKFAKIWIKYVQFMIDCAEAFQRDQEGKATDEDRITLEEMNKFLNCEDHQGYIKDRLRKWGAKIPDDANVKIVIDSSLPSWPAVYIRSDKKSNDQLKQGEIVLEPSSGVHAEWVELSDRDLMETTRWHNKAREIEHLSGTFKAGQTDYISRFGLVESDVVIRIPFINPNEDIFYSIKFEDSPNDTIVLSSCS